MGKGLGFGFAFTTPDDPWACLDPAVRNLSIRFGMLAGRLIVIYMSDPAGICGNMPHSLCPKSTAHAGRLVMVLRKEARL